jgi:hypothetical protein
MYNTDVDFGNYQLLFRLGMCLSKDPEVPPSGINQKKCIHFYQKMLKNGHRNTIYFSETMEK